MDLQLLHQIQNPIMFLWLLDLYFLYHSVLYQQLFEDHTDVQFY
ncbi:uncharacterized protein METZ01_LOCUS147443 [marine metagenome]|uniref:Uncharacterized protein n=1 Tax=marine metagenome TaxID=408172 RepID=A0A381ZZM3_9ZZZZ